MWDAWLRDRDSDGDGRTNGQEVMYFGSLFNPPEAGFNVGPVANATMPGFATSYHTDECTLQSSVDWGYSTAPRNYTNCALVGAMCTDDSDDASMPEATRYFGFECSCSPGYIGNGRRDVSGDNVADGSASGCSDLDECALEDRCFESMSGNTCTNDVGTYACTCGSRFTLSAPPYPQCLDIDECGAAAACGRNMSTLNTCTNFVGSHACTCAPGFVRVSAGTAAESCNDVNECDTPTTCNANLGYGTCTNTTGGYTCACTSGRGFDGTTCVPTSECTGINNCHSNAQCTDTPTSYTCACRAGFTGDGFVTGTGCTDINECAAAMACGRNLSASNTCANEPGAYTCSCGAGFRPSGSGRTATCVDIDECSIAATCGGMRTSCTNTVGSYSCGCAAGFTAPASGGSCTDADECATDGRCGTGATSCLNLPGSYQCECATGYRAAGTGVSCEAYDECAFDNPCGPGTCSDTTSGHTCACPTGFSETGGHCVDDNECASAPCGLGLCMQNDPGHYTCARCPTGYTAPALDGTCADNDECLLGTAVCDPNGHCVNQPGTYSCACNVGYEGSGTICDDIDECLDSVPDECDVEATCTNTPGSYICTCREGYRRVGTGCEDVDECLDGSLFCARDELCLNHLGAAAECICAPGFQRATPEAPCLPACGDGVRGPGEECDDGNDAAEDGCTECEVDVGWVCMEPEVVSVCSETCGDGLIHLEAGEECDDGGANSDAEADACRVRCLLPFCGDMVVDEGEACDSGDANSDEVADACRTDCQPAYCGDGVVDDGEACDPGRGPLDSSRCSEDGCNDDPPDAGGVDAGTEPPDSDPFGCSAAATSRSGGFAWLALIPVAVFLVRRRRR